MMKNIFTIGTLVTLLLVLTLLPLTYALVVESIVIEPREIQAGESATVEIGLKNNGDITLEDVSVTLDLSTVPFAPSDLSSEFSIEEIQKGKIKYARFKVVALNSAQPDIYKIPLKISYREEDQVEGQPFTKNSLMSLSVSSQPSISLNAEESFVIKNQNNDVTIKLVNKGLGEIKFLEVTIKNTPYVTFLSPNTIYIGDLSSDDFDSVDMKLFVKNDAPSKITVPVTIIYKDPLNKEYQDESTIPLTVYTEDEAIKLGLVEKRYTVELGIIIVLLVVFYLLYRYIRRTLRKRAGKENSI